jgi:hypothetical protein
MVVLFELLVREPGFVMERSRGVYCLTWSHLFIEDPDFIHEYNQTRSSKGEGKSKPNTQVTAYTRQPTPQTSLTTSRKIRTLVYPYGHLAQIRQSNAPLYTQAGPRSSYPALSRLSLPRPASTGQCPKACHRTH